MTGRKVGVSVIGVASVAICGFLAFAGHTKTPAEQNKETVTAFYKTAFNDRKPAEAIANYVGGSYKQHNPMVADGSLPFIDFVTEYTKANPKLRVDIKRVIAEGDYVVTHVHIRTSEKDRGLAAIDIFRLENGKIVEHWDTVQPVPETSANTNTMF